MNKGLAFFVACVVFIIAGAEIWGIPYETLRNGSHTGTVTAVEDSGVFWKTVTIYFKTDAQSSQEDMYCLKDRTLLPRLIEYEKSKAKVTLHFNDYLMKGLKNCNGEPGGIITGITE